MAWGDISEGQLTRRPIRHPWDTTWLPVPVHAPPRLRVWLTDRGSLTQRIQDRCPGFSVRRVEQRLERPARDERRLIGIAAHQHAMTREVCLYCFDTPVVFAHTVLDPAHVAGPWRSLSRLGSRPLGAALFANPRVHRRPLHFRRLTRRHELFARAIRVLGCEPASLWARRSMFLLEDAPILVTEVFLPAILELPA